MSRTPAKITQADIARALRAAEQVLPGKMTVEIAPDGTIKIVPRPFYGSQSVPVVKKQDWRL